MAEKKETKTKKNNKVKTEDKKTTKKGNETRKEKKVEEKVKVTKDNNKFVFKVWEVVIIMIITAIIGIFIGCYVAYHKYNNRKVSCSSIRKDMDEIGSIYDGMLNDYYGEVEKDKLIDSAIRGMVGELNDPYASFIDSKTATLLDEELSGEFIGLGVEISAREEYITVVSVYQDSPAAKAGISVGDKIVSMDGKKYLPEDMNDLVYEIKSSSRGDKRKFELIRDGYVMNVEVSLDEVELQSVSSYIVNNNNKNIGIFVINNFANNTYDQFLSNYDILTKDNSLDSLVIDLRSNGGGYLSSANQVASLFLDKGAIVYQRTDGEKTEKVESENEKKITIPVVLLVDGGTASSAEVFVSALHENLGSEIVGANTYGKGTIQKMYILSNGGYVKFTVEEWLTSKGNKVEGVGLAPQIEVSWDESSSHDVQLEKAIETASAK